MNLVELASRIKMARISKGYTLERVADLSGLAKGLLSKVENFRVTPSLPTLSRIADALGLSLPQLFEGLDDKPKLSMVRAGERRRIERDRDQSNIDYFALAHARADRKMDPFILSVPPGGGRNEAMPHEGEEFLTVLEGGISFQYEGEVHQLSAGDSVYFDAEVDHRVFNDRDDEAKVFCVFLGRPL
ncbi:MAG: cupin domain-containing protein [Verrucomicrobiaceae bacterium]|nr:MAG: cupin domain-containing protein [Verrucomicrobiaceae bacterium]